MASQFPTAAEMIADMAKTGADAISRAYRDMENERAICPDQTWQYVRYEPGARPIWVDLSRWADDGGRG